MSEANFSLPKFRYLELKYFCLQYNSWEDVANNGVSSSERAKARIAMYQVNNALFSFDTDFEDILFDCVTNGVSYKKLKEKYGEKMPEKEVFYDAYRKFFYFLSKAKGI